MLKHFESFFQLISIFVIISDVDCIKIEGRSITILGNKTNGSKQIELSTESNKAVLSKGAQSKPKFVKISIFLQFQLVG